MTSKEPPPGVMVDGEKSRDTGNSEPQILQIIADHEDNIPPRRNETGTNGRVQARWVR